MTFGTCDWLQGVELTAVIDSRVQVLLLGRTLSADGAIRVTCHPGYWLGVCLPVNSGTHVCVVTDCFCGTHIDNTVMANDVAVVETYCEVRVRSCITASEHNSETVAENE